MDEGFRITREQIVRLAFEADKDGVVDVLLTPNYYSRSVSLDLRDERDESIGYVIVEQDGEVG